MPQHRTAPAVCQPGDIKIRRSTAYRNSDRGASSVTPFAEVSEKRQPYTVVRAGEMSNEHLRPAEYMMSPFPRCLSKCSPTARIPAIHLSRGEFYGYRSAPACRAL